MPWKEHEKELLGLENIVIKNHTVLEIAWTKHEKLEKLCL